MSPVRRAAAFAFAIGVAVLLWLLAAVELWDSAVPGNLDLPDAESRDHFTARELDRAEEYEAFLRFDFLLAQATTLLVLALYAWRGHRFMRESAAGRIGSAMLLGMLGLGILGLTQVPFGLAALWWDRRHDVVDVGYAEWLLEWALLLSGEFAFICLALLIVVGFAQVLRGRWWIAGAPTFVALYALFAFSYPYLLVDVEPLRDPELAASAREYAREQGVDPIPVRVEEVSSYTSAANAEAAGLGVSRRIILWDTLLNGRYADDEVEVVLAHEIGHHSRGHIEESIGWYGLFAVPGTLLIALATRRRGTLREPEAVPLALLVFVALQFAAQPILGVISRRMEAEADWMALEATEQPDAARRLFRHFTTEELSDPDPPAWSRLVLGTHPTTLERIALAEAWRRRHR